MLNPHILILDDSTSSVDLETEYRIQQALDRLMEGRTSFVIAQRIATVLNADQILVLDKGQIVAHGTHENLMETSEIYAEIYYSQLLEGTEGDGDKKPSALPHGDGPGHPGFGSGRRPPGGPPPSRHPPGRPGGPRPGVPGDRGKENES